MMISFETKNCCSFFQIIYSFGLKKPSNHIRFFFETRDFLSPIAQLTCILTDLMKHSLMQ